MVQFRIADKIASDLGFSLDHPDRVDTVLLYVLNEYAGSRGHTFLNRLHLPESCNAFLKDNCEIMGSLNKQHIAGALSRCFCKGQM